MVTLGPVKLVSAPIEAAMDQAAKAAREYAGATRPNPPVGAAALDASGQILSVQAHTRAGEPHAEARVLADLKARGLSAHTIVVTLEPCNHQGRTPPCAQAILGTPTIRRVVFACRDPNKLASGGAEVLRAAGLEVIEEPHEASRLLLQPFSQWITTGKPWIVLKTALDRNGSMIPPKGQKTFTSEDSLRFAHQLRKESDAIITGSGTVLTDDPSFTVRLVPDHPGKRRFVALLDRRKRVSQAWIDAASQRGLDVFRVGSIEEAILELGSRSVLQALVEAGPTLTNAFLSGCLWNRHVVIQQGRPGEPDRIQDQCSQGSSKV